MDTRQAAFEIASRRMDSPEASGARRWVLLAVGSLLLAGLLSALLVVARAPVFSGLVSDPSFFRRCLVVHVDLSLLVWIYAFAAALSFLLPRAGASSRLSRVGVLVSAAGVLSMLLAAGVRGSQPVLANYVPVIDHWSFDLGLVLFAAGVLMSVLDSRVLPSDPAPGSVLPIPGAAVPGLRAMIVVLLLALLTFSASWLHTPKGLEPSVAYELGMWGGGHVLQLASATAMASVWLILLGGLLGRSPISRRTAAILFGLLVLPWAMAPLLAARGVQSVAGREGFTLLMRWGIFPAISLLLLACLGAVRRGFADGTLGRESLRDVRLVGFFASAGLSVLGFVLGALIRGSTTMIPAHYHASIGAVTVAFMAIAYPLLDAVGVRTQRTPFTRRFVPLQPAIFGIGQSIFAIGFALAGANGMGRKLYGAEQNARSLAQKLGLGVMGLGGLVAIVGGVLFLSIVVSAWWRRERIQLVVLDASPELEARAGTSTSP